MTVEADDSYGAVAGEEVPAAPAPRRRRWPRRLFRLAVALALAPLVLTVVYWLVPPVSTLMLADLVTGRGYTRDWVSFDEISPQLPMAVVMGEDGKFCSHGGVDWDSLGAVLSRSGGPNRGASTVTMQTVKNLYLWNGRSYLRKAMEIPLALYVDLVWSKRRTMEIYLNIAEWGPNLYGAEAAAQKYFKKPAAKLTRHEAALLVSALPNPIERNPAKPGKYQARYARTVERRTAQAGAYVDCLFDR
ncbi:monofunctional biosynthetic peptidoglycan transglycosylase [Oharaeibacter diazotrophicus]|uniref:Biosynthetic peptidoglycan transglycosylase n=1 Tax=Oharaeibacter diazotrophicus TaxID=1920512 RepID=A0A4R6REJ5_9HYPH|nr:monofunctional biosynthetic peptidoglycan transglycosylase [Oharaeibacter diazotrophicus]TDP84096.1 monofunctional biosynthetic peptidoglycan transglycosylase [Oharaeibacter diazotrophicus]BBE73135.1 penicillin-binding protein 1F [Pleomorphomonas sp. SM30]GLS74924.1 monofunctional biosynthetic peptidoglycan transglycosylase [Oharaeibacter diazotrophicus]